MNPRGPVQRDFLMRRNALWARLRGLEPGDPGFEAALSELSAVTGWDRTRVLAGLGWPAGPTQSQGPSDPHATPARQADAMTDKQQHDQELEQERPDPSSTAPAEGASRSPSAQEKGKGQGADLAYDAPPVEGERDD